MSSRRDEHSRSGVLTLGALVLILGGCGTAVLTSPGSAVLDTDLDGLTDQRERRLGTDPDNPDTDFDGLLDGHEMSQGTSPLARDSDGDGLMDSRQPVPQSQSPHFTAGSRGNDIEPNDTFDQAVALDNIGARFLTYEGQIDRGGDVDVFDLGPLSAGDRITIDLVRASTLLRPSVGLFDATQAVFVLARDRYAPGGPDQPGFIEQTIRHGSQHYYFAVTHRPDDDTIGAYRFDVSIDRGGVAPRPSTQVVFLDFEHVASPPAITAQDQAEPFAAAAISAKYAGLDDKIKRSIVDTLAENFADFDLIFLTSDQEDVIPAEVTTITFGSSNSDVLGWSVKIDEYNVDPDDRGMVFTENFNPDVLGFSPPAQALGVAIGNVATHEIGHLLGLQHVRDVSAMMDETAPANVLIGNRSFKAARLAEDVFPIGWQDSATLLAETVGGR